MDQKFYRQGWGSPKAPFPAPGEPSAKHSFLPLSNQSEVLCPRELTSLYRGASSFPKIQLLELFLLFPRRKAK